SYTTVDPPIAPPCALSPLAKLSCATEANVDFIASAISQGTSSANGAAFSNVRLFIPEFYQIARDRIILNWFSVETENLIPRCPVSAAFIRHLPRMSRRMNSSTRGEFGQAGKEERRSGTSQAPPLLH